MEVYLEELKFNIVCLLIEMCCSADILREGFPERGHWSVLVMLFSINQSRQDIGGKSLFLFDIPGTCDEQGLDKIYFLVVQVLTPTVIIPQMK